MSFLKYLLGQPCKALTAGPNVLCKVLFSIGLLILAAIASYKPWPNCSETPLLAGTLEAPVQIGAMEDLSCQNNQTLV